MLCLRAVLLVSCFLFLEVVAPAQVAESKRTARNSALVEARTAFDRGEFERGIELVQAAVLQDRPHKGSDWQSDAALLLSEGYEALGRNGDSARVLEEALARTDDAAEGGIYVRARLASAYRLAGDVDRARPLLERALNDADRTGRRDLRAAVLNELGAAQAASEDLESAFASFAKSAQLAGEAGLRELELTARINEIGALIQYGRSEHLDVMLSHSVDIARTMPDSIRKALCLLSLGSEYWLAQHWFGLDAGWRKSAYDAYVAGLAVARDLGNHRLNSHGFGSIGRLYEDERRFDEALRYTRLAVLEAERAEAPDILYLWQWQRARIMREEGETEKAISDYRQSIRTLDGIRSSLSRSATAFQTVVGPVFLELADLLLRRAAAAEDTQSNQRDLAEVLATVEKLNQAEVAEYFRDDCVVQTPGATQLERLSEDAAVVYPVLLPDRIELVLSAGGSLARVSVPVGISDVTEVIREFRQNIETFEPRNRFMPQSRRLYEWLLEPLEKELQRAHITTLVFVPAGPLRTIPFSALHDGESFLIEKYAIVTTPGLTLTSSTPIPRTGVRTLAAGLTAGVQGFNPLPSVKSELAGIESLFPTVRLQDRTFRTSSVESAVSRGDYSIVHLATHGFFDSDHSKSFLLTFDGRLTMDALQSTVARRKYSDEPLELLVLSACETAAGDDRAALGLAGAGLRAGSRSVVATLWPISDESTAMLISDFYRRLKDPKVSKAEALREAQRELLKETRFRHPFFWAPFLLIGNWL